MRKAFVSAVSVVLLVACGDTQSNDSLESTEQSIVDQSGKTIDPSTVKQIKLVGQGAINKFNTQLSNLGIDPAAHTTTSGQLQLGPEYAARAAAQPIAPTSSVTVSPPVAAVEVGAPAPAPAPQGFLATCLSCLHTQGAAVVEKIIVPTEPAVKAFLTQLEQIGVNAGVQFADGVLTIVEKDLETKVTSTLSNMGAAPGANVIPMLPVRPTTSTAAHH